MRLPGGNQPREFFSPQEKTFAKGPRADLSKQAPAGQKPRGAAGFTACANTAYQIT
jgi:hypothetical protein